MPKKQGLEETGPVEGPVRPAKTRSPAKRPNAKYVTLTAASNDGGVKYWLTPEGYRKVADMAAGGFSQAGIAQALGVHPSTLSAWKAHDELLREAFNVGHGALETEVVSTLVQHMREGSTTAAIFLAKGKLHFREVGPADPHAQQGPVVNIVVPPALSVEDARALLSAARGEPKVIDHE